MSVGHCLEGQVVLAACENRQQYSHRVWMSLYEQFINFIEQKRILCYLAGL
jgi:hypothetical protein